MTCIPIHGHGFAGFVCVSEQVRLHVGNKYVWMSWHDYTGPSFYTVQRGMEIPYEPKDESDPVWAEFDKWNKKRLKAKERHEILRTPKTT